MFQPQPTPFASSLHVQAPHSLPQSHSHHHDHSHTHPSRIQHGASHNVGGYGMSLGSGAGGGGMGGSGVGMMAPERGQMNDYSFSAANTRPMRMGLGIGLAGHSHGHSMGVPLSHGGLHQHQHQHQYQHQHQHNNNNSMAMGGMDDNSNNLHGIGMAGMAINMGLQQRSQSLSLGGVGEPASAPGGVGAGAGAVSASAAARAATARSAHSGRGPPAPPAAPGTTTGAASLSPLSPLTPQLGGPGPEPSKSPQGAPAVALAPAALPANHRGPGIGSFQVSAAATFHNHHHSSHHNSPGTSASHSLSHSHALPPGPGAPNSSSSSSTFYNLDSEHSNCNSVSNPSSAPASTVNPASTRPSTMEPGDSSASDLAAQEAAARDYQPQLEGPLVGDKITSDAITDEYAKADDVYVAKTVALPQTYSHYRPIQGDGNCGWRAVGFSYFEHLVNNGDHDQILGEIARITSLNQYLLNVGGYDRMLFEDMVDETIALLRDLANNISNPQLAHQLVLQRFNDQDASNAIIYHLRLLASSWLKGNPDDYAPFIPGETGIAGYCAELERPNREIEHLGLQLLVQVLLKPANMVLEIAYLDRSVGDQVNSYRMPNEAIGQDPANLGPIICLLYRPDHYDILYKPVPNPIPHPLTLQVNRATSFSHRHEIINVAPSLQTFTNMDYSSLAMLPGFGGPSSGLSSGLSSLGSPTPTSPMPDGYDGLPQSSWMANPYSDHVQQQQPQQQSAPAPRPPPQSTSQPQSQQSTPISGKPSQSVDYQLRFSRQCWHLSNSGSSQPSILASQPSFPEPSFTTAMFKNSHFNKAHYQNPHFHPEEWTPDDEVHERIPTVKKKGKIKSEH